MTRKSELPHIPRLKMIEGLVDALRFLHFGVSTNFWGLGCPAHCRGVDLGSLIAAFLSGFVLAALCASFLFYQWISRSSEPLVPRPAFLGHGPSFQHRLQGYVHG